jgi:hypothetical protein
MRYWTLLAMSVVVAAGCGAGHKGATASSVGDTKAKASNGVTRPAHSPPPGSLGSAFSYTELPEGKHAKSIDCGGHLAAVDYRSKLVIKPDKTRIEKLAGTKKDVLPPLSPDAQVRLKNLPKLIQDAEAYVADASRVLKAVKAARGSGRELSEAQIKQLQQEIAAQGQKGKALADLVIEVAEARARARYADDTDAFTAEVGRLTSPVIKDAQDKRVILNVKGFGAFLSEEIDFATAQARRDAELAEREGTVQFRMWAWLRSQSDWVSVENYFDAGSFDGPKRPRVTFRMSEAEQQRLKQGYETADQVAGLLRDVQDKKSPLQSELAALWTALGPELKALSELPPDKILTDVNDLLMKAIGLASGSSEANPEQKKELDKLKTFIGKLNDDLTKIRTVFQGLKATASSAEFIRKYMAFTADVNAALTAAAALPEAIRVNLDRLNTLSEVLKKMKTAESQALLASLGEQVLPNTKKQLDALASGQLPQYAALAAKVQALLNGAQTLNLADGLDTSRERPPVRAVKLDEIMDGTIDLNKTRADRGSELTVRAELFTTDEKGQETVLQWTEQSFHVDRFGLTSGFSANVLFVNRLGSGTPGDPDTRFDPAPSASWNLHYRLPPDADETWPRKLYRFFDAGFGINTAALDFEDKNVQIGAGGHLTLFEDLLVFGYGYNLQAETDHGYFYFGIGVLEALDTIGSLFGAASGRVNRGN